KLMLGEIAPDRGTVRLGTQLQVAYFDQLREQLDDSATLVETISPGSDWIAIGGRRPHVMSYLERFLFAPARARSPVGSLSGRPRARGAPDGWPRRAPASARASGDRAMRGGRGLAAPPASGWRQAFRPETAAMGRPHDRHARQRIGTVVPARQAARRGGGAVI